jgi:hypothetical protein
MVQNAAKTSDPINHHPTVDFYGKYFIKFGIFSPISKGLAHGGVMLGGKGAPKGRKRP